MSRDEIYRGDSSGNQPFEFNNAVARVFPDMLSRSIPGYAASLEAIRALAGRFVQPASRCFDLGCSLGAATLAMQAGIRVPDCHIVAIDNSAAMVKRCREIVASESTPSGPPVEVIEADLRDSEIHDASMVVMNYTLQFVPGIERGELLGRICDGMTRGGLLVLSEKVVDEDPEIEAMLVELHHDFKRKNAYSDLEISRKRAALENVLVPDTIRTHRERLAAAGFRHSGIWLRHFNFVSILAIR